MKHLMFLAAAMMLSGCVVSPTAPAYADAPKPELTGGNAVLYVYREHAEPTAFKAFITDGDRKIVSLPQKAFSWVYLESDLNLAGSMLTTTMEVRGMNPDVASAFMTKCCQYVQAKAK